jgi:hypothetical protein
MDLPALLFGFVIILVIAATLILGMTSGIDDAEND